jgi:hypothetical protein
MTIETHYQYLEEEVKKKEEQIQDKQSQIDLLKDGIATDKALLKIMKVGLEKVKQRLPKNANP